MIIAESASPVTVAEVHTALRSAGVVEGEAIIVHSSLSRLGWVVGGPLTILGALIEAVGPDGTIVMPAQTGVSDPSEWENPPVPESWWPTIRDNWPAFDPMLTPLRGMGAVVECFQRMPDVLHSGHPAVGFLARGRLAESIVATHPLEESLGDSSPLGRLYEADARIVLIGVGHGNNTSLHLCEHRADYPTKRAKSTGAPMLVDGARRWVTYDDLDHDDEDFVELGKAFLANGGSERRAPVGVGELATYRMREIIDFGVDWIAHHRVAPPEATPAGTS